MPRRNINSSLGVPRTCSFWLRFEESLERNCSVKNRWQVSLGERHCGLGTGNCRQVYGLHTDLVYFLELLYGQYLAEDVCWVNESIKKQMQDSGGWVASFVEKLSSWVTWEAAWMWAVCLLSITRATWKGRADRFWLIISEVSTHGHLALLLWTCSEVEHYGGSSR